MMTARQKNALTGQLTTYMVTWNRIEYEDVWFTLHEGSLVVKGEADHATALKLPSPEEMTIFTRNACATGSGTRPTVSGGLGTASISGAAVSSPSMADVISGTEDPLMAQGKDPWRTYRGQNY